MRYTFIDKYDIKEIEEVINLNQSIIIYFSRADENYAVGFIKKGNTEVLAEYIKELTGADIFKVEPKVPYAKDYQTCIEEAGERQKMHNAPIVSPIPDLTQYDVIYLGSPVYYMPEELVTALKEIDFTGKTIYPFVTHEGSGFARIPSQIQEICHGAQVGRGLAIKGSQVRSAKEQVAAWLDHE